jgi:hypothetical protein
LPAFFLAPRLLLPAVRFFFIATLQLDRPNQRHSGNAVLSIALVRHAPKRASKILKRVRVALG